MDDGRRSHGTAMTVGELARRGGVKASTVRFWEDQGLLTSHRTSGNQRRFDDASLARVEFIRWSQEFGASLQTIGEVLQMLPDGTAPGAEVRARASQCWREILDDEARDLQDRYRRLFQTTPQPAGVPGA
ncbi:MAG: MerR family transcriptional regulator [Microbacterium sp.]|jgi:MerR family redox-sensitive transcriptional activator SoxR|nr:MerR family transcriptional regulator [Microbacterium sp.]